MSSIPGGPVTISFIADRTQVDSFLAELRRGIRVPVQADFIGPAGNYGQQSAASVAASGGPATFSNPNGAPVYTNGPAGFYAGLMPNAGTPGVNTAYGMLPLTPAPPGAPAPPANNQLQQGVTQLTGAINQLAQAFATFAAQPPANNPANVPSPGGGGYGSRRMSLGRYLTYSFFAREGLNVLDAGSQYNIDAAMSNGQPSGMLDAEMGYYNRVAGIPIFGQAANYFADPGGSRRLEIASLQKQASLQDQVSSGAYGYGMFALNQERGAALAQLTGPAKMREQAEQAYLVAINKANEGYAEQAGKVQAAFAVGNAVLADRFHHAQIFANPSESRSGQAAIDSQYQAEVQKRAGELNSQLAALERDRQRAYDAAASARAGTLSMIGLPAELTIPSYGYESDIARETAKPYVNTARVRYLQNQADKVQREQIGYSRGFEVADAWMDLQTAQRQEKYGIEDRQLESNQIGAYGVGKSAWQRAFGNNFAASMTDLFTQFRQRAIANRDPRMILPNAFEFFGQVGAHVGDAYRSFQEANLNITGASSQIAAMIQHNPLGAEIARIQNENEQQKLQYARMPGGSVLSAGADTLMNQRIGYARQEDYIHFSRAQIGIQAQTRSFDIMAGSDPRYAGAQPGELPLLARIQEFTDDTRGAERDAMFSGHPELINDLAKRGRSGLAAMKAQYMRGFMAQEMDPMLTALSGPGTFSGSNIDKAFGDATRDIGKPATTDSENATLGRIETVLHQLIGPIMNWLNAGG